MKVLSLTLMLVFIWSQPLCAEIAVSDLPPLAEIFEAPCLELDIPKAALMAIAKVESGFKPWVLNIEGQPFRFDSKEKALEKAQETWDFGRSFDVGLMQINSWWLKRYGIPIEAALDPLANVYFGGWIFKEELKRHGKLKTAIGAYHSPKPARANHYANVVMAALEKGPQEASERIKILAVTPQDATSKKARQTPDSSHILLAAPEEKFPIPMLVISKSKVMANQSSMKLAGTNPQNSMKVSVGR